jgi:alkaline phosphatase
MYKVQKIVKLILSMNLFVLLISFSCWRSNVPSIPKNVILFIGDGMGVTHITAAKTVKGNLNLEEFKVAGLITTHCEDRYVTDSGAAATALATGNKTYYSGISMTASGNPMKTVLEYAKEIGKSTGLVVTSRITHATPAAFASHAKDRELQSEIAEDLVQSGVEVLFGGGLAYFLPNSDEQSRRNDEKNLIEKLKKKYLIALNRNDFDMMGTPQAAVGLFAESHLPSVDQRIVSLTEMTQKALDILSVNTAGFFLMVEGSQIDFAAEDNESDLLIKEMIDFDEAIGAGLSFAGRNTNTLVLVVADHEAGGYALNDGSIEKKVITEPRFTTNDHTGTMVPIFAKGPMDHIFGGIHDNTDIGKMLIELVQEKHYNKF